MGSVDTVCDMSNRHVSHGHPMNVVQPACTPSQIEWNFMIFLYSVRFTSPNCQAISTEANTTETQLKCFKFGGLEDTKADVIDTVKVLKCYSGIAI